MKSSLEVVEVGMGGLPRRQRSSAAAAAYSDLAGPRTQRARGSAGAYSSSVGTVERVMLLEDVRTMGLGARYSAKVFKALAKQSRKRKKLSTTAKVGIGAGAAGILALVFL